MKAKMYQSSTMTEMEKAVDGYYLKMQASDIGDIAEKDVAEQLNKMVKWSMAEQKRSCVKNYEMFLLYYV